MGTRSADGNGSEHLSELSSEYCNDSKMDLMECENRLIMAEVLGDRETEKAMLCEMGNVYRRLGDLEDAIHYHILYLRLALKMGNRISENRA